MSNNSTPEHLETPHETDKRVWLAATKLKDSGVLDLTGARISYATLLDELQKQQIFIESDNLAHPDHAPNPQTMSPAELEALSRLRATFPSEEDRIWQSSLSTI